MTFINHFIVLSWKRKIIPLGSKSTELKDKKIIRNLIHEFFFLLFLHEISFSQYPIVVVQHNLNDERCLNLEKRYCCFFSQEAGYSKFTHPFP